MITCALPTYNNSRTLWLQIESLCRQKTEVKWELIVMEEQSQFYAGLSYFDDYQDRLALAGCVDLKYIPCSRMPLGQKWKRLAQEANYPIFHLVAGDNYSPPSRLQKSFEAFSADDQVLWCDWRQSAFLNLQTGSTAVYRCQNEHKTGVFMACATDRLQKLSAPYPPRNIDGWVRDSVPELRKGNEHRRHYIHEMPNGIHTDGMNVISLHRRDFYRRDKPYQTSSGFTPLPCAVSSLLPSDIVQSIKTRFNIQIK